jgi:hypothetical protein
MPVTKADVLSVLEDPGILMRIRFSVGPLTVSYEEYQNVAEYIKDDDIQVIPGTGSVAFYDGRLNAIITQKEGRKPLDYTDRAQILHECTHAIADVNELDMRRLEDEVAAYLAQDLYMAHTYDNWVFAPAGAVTFIWGQPFGSMVNAMKDIIDKYHLLTARGYGARISELDTWKLTLFLRAMPEYKDVKLTETTNKESQRGVPTKNQMRLLRAAMKRGQRGHKQAAYSPSPRIAGAQRNRFGRPRDSGDDQRVF